MKTSELAEQLNESEMALITDGADRMYLTGFNSSAGIVVITRKTQAFIIDFRYYEMACKKIKHLKVILMNNLMKQINEIIKNDGIKIAYVKTGSITVSEFNGYNKTLECELSHSDKLDVIMRDLRKIKDKSELSNIKIAQEFTDKTFDYILPRIEKGRTEREIMLDMEFYMRKLGSEGVSFDFIVVSGKNSSLPHGVPTDKKVEDGDFITMDFGAVYNGYHSDMTRTVVVGKASDEQKKVYNTVLKAQELALLSIKPNAVCKEIDEIARDYIYKEYEGCFGHALGHSVGVEIHEYPNFNHSCMETLKRGMIMTVEPGIYLENKFGVRIEDMVFITENGYENLTKSKKELIEL